MIATITAQSHMMASTVDFPVMLNSNTAGAPLPLIPRRTSSVGRSFSGASTSTTPKTSPVKITVQQATPPMDDDDTPSLPTPPRSASQFSSSSSSARLTPRVKITRSVRPAPCAIPVTPAGTPRSKKEELVFPSKPDSDGNERLTVEASSSKLLPFASKPLTLEGLPHRSISESYASPPAEVNTHKSAPVETPSPPLVIRKKSGQLVKSSLKSRSSFKGNLTINHASISSKSEPATPTVSKAVHFDSRLEHVKLFLAEQRPLAVSRDGSPTDDTSGTDSDFPTFIYGNSSDKKSNKTLTMKVVNMPLYVDLESDVVLQEMKLSTEGTSIFGRVRVRNLAFNKWVAVRFTLDDWQTTSEVTAKYTEPAGGDFDIFSFTIRLIDLLARIDEKTLVMAIRYNVVGREIWDNNLGQNYIVKFALENTRPAPKSEGSDRDASSGSDLSDLTSRLEKVVQRRDKEGIPSFTPRQPRPQLTSPQNSLSFKSGASLASRYDFGNSLKSSLNRDDSSAGRAHTRMHSHPVVASGSTGSVPWPSTSSSSYFDHRRPPQSRSISIPLGSPRDLDNDSFRPAPYVPSEDEDAPFPKGGFRNHQRGFFDLSPLDTSTIRKTPPGTPGLRSPEDGTLLTSARFHSFPPVDSRMSCFVASPLSDVPSPSVSLPIQLSSAALGSDESVSPKTNYHQFLNRFCFFTGSESSGSDSSSPGILSRTSSASSIEDILTSTSPRLHEANFGRLFSTPRVNETRDDMFIRSGSITPTQRSLLESRMATPVSN